VSYVDAGYAIALAALFLYAVSLLVRRRRWERALKLSQPPPSHPHSTGDGAHADGQS
jgi:uncharacterized protein (TIGR03382 family)